MTPAEIGHDFARWGPFLLVLLWAGMATVLRRRPPRPQEPPAPPRVVQRPPSVPPPIRAAYDLVGRPREAPRPPGPSEAEIRRAAEAARIEAAAEVEAVAKAAQTAAAAERVREQLVLGGWQRAVVLTELLGPPIALRRPGTLGPPGAF